MGGAGDFTYQFAILWQAVSSAGAPRAKYMGANSARHAVNNEG